MPEQWEVEATMPQLVLPSPQCSHCGGDVQIDGDSAWCEGCRVAWDRIWDGEVGHPDPDAEGSDVPCEIVPTPSALYAQTLVYGPCILPSGHEGDHEAPMRRVGGMSTPVDDLTPVLGSRNEGEKR